MLFLKNEAKNSEKKFRVMFWRVTCQKCGKSEQNKSIRFEIIIIILIVIIIIIIIILYLHSFISITDQWHFTYFSYINYIMLVILCLNLTIW